MVKTKTVDENNFFDIKPLKDWGLIVFPLSMSGLNNKQSIDPIINWLEFFGDKKAGEPKIGINFIYCDFLYLNSNEPSINLKEKFTHQMVSHVNGLKNAIYKKRKIFQIQHAAHFQTWGNLYLEVEGDFNSHLDKIEKLYREDNQFRDYIKEDSKFYKKILTKTQLAFFIEEHLMTCLILSKRVKLRNEYVQGREKWILLAYPGIPPKALIYLLQKNPLKFFYENPIIGLYNLLNKKFYDYNNIDLNSWDYK